MNRRIAVTVPLGVTIWYVLAYGPWLLQHQHGVAWSHRRWMPLGPDHLATVLTGSVVAAVAVALLIGAVRWAVGEVLVLTAVCGFGAYAWARHHGVVVPGARLRTVLLTAAVAGVVAALVASLCARNPVPAACVAAVPVCRYVAWLPGLVHSQRWAPQLGIPLIAAGLAFVLYLACWRRGWRAAVWWPVVAAAYVAGFALVSVWPVLAAAITGSVSFPDGVADAFANGFWPVLRDAWAPLLIGVFVAIMLVALRLRLPSATGEADAVRARTGTPFPAP